MTGVTNLVKEKCPTIMLHDDMTLARLMVYAQSITESKLDIMSTNLKMSGLSDQDQPRFKKRAQNQKEPRSA